MGARAWPVILNPGDTLLLYSDGVTEARAGTVFFGDQRLATTQRATTGLHAAAAAQLIETSVLNFADDLDDDLAVLALRRLDTQAAGRTVTSSGATTP